MAIKSLKIILDKGKKTLINDGENSCFFVEKKLGNLEKDKKNECLTSLELKVIDFDKTEKELSKHRRTRKSCDAIKFVINREPEEIHFIEMKSIVNFNKDKKIKSWEDRIKKIENFKFYKKITDSIQTMTDVIENKKMDLNNLVKKSYYDTKKYPILLVDIDKEKEYEESFKFTLDFLALKNELYKIDIKNSQNIEPARLSYCGGFDKKYK